MAIMFGDEDYAASSETGTIRKTWLVPDNQADLSGENGKEFFTINGRQVTVTEKKFYNAKDEPVEISSWTTDGPKVSYVTALVSAADIVTIDINSDKFPGTYYITGDTFIRNEDTGEDEFFQLIFAKAKMLSEVTLTMEAEGDPSTFSMNLKILKPRTGPMMQLIKYDLAAPVNG